MVGSLYLADLDTDDLISRVENASKKSFWFKPYLL